MDALDQLHDCAIAAEVLASWAPGINVGPEVSQGVSGSENNEGLAETDIAKWLDDPGDKSIPAWSTEDPSEGSVLLARTEDEFTNPEAYWSVQDDTTTC